MKRTKILMASVIMLISANLKAQEAMKPATATAPKKETDHIVELTTDYGTMKIKLYNETPKHRDNFLKLVKEGFYNGLLFHRVIPNFMIQGGDPDSKNAAPDKMLGNGGPGYQVPAEFNPKFIHKKGALAAARTSDQINPQKESSGSQFYIVQGNKITDPQLDQIQQSNHITYSPEQRNAYKNSGGTPFLDMNYTVFGEVIEGLDVIDKIAAVKTKPGDRPEKDVKMTMKVIK